MAGRRVPDRPPLAADLHPRLIGLYDRARPNGTETRTGLIDAQGVRKPAFRVFQRGR